MKFNQFLFKWRENTLHTDPAWRAYDFPGSVRPRFVQKALKSLGLTYAGELAIPQFMSLYDVPTAEEARLILGSWWLWSLVDDGRQITRGPHGLKRRAYQTSPVGG
jgi:hypothetical protein